MPQCRDKQMNGIQCVLEEGHEPISALIDGSFVIFEHNHGGLGPYTSQTLSHTPDTRPTWDMIWMGNAHGVARRSLCTRDKVGALIVTPDNVPLMSGYNGPPAGFNHQGKPCIAWCPRAQCTDYSWVGTSETAAHAIDIKSEHDGEFWKMSSLPDIAVSWRRVTDEDMTKLGFVKRHNLSPSYDDCPSLHAEANTLAKSNHMTRKGGTIYVTSDMCYSCAKLVANSGLSRVVVDQTVKHEHRNANKSYDFLRLCGLEVVLLR